MASNDPHFEHKAADIIGLYMNPPQHAAVFLRGREDGDSSSGPPRLVLLEDEVNPVMSALLENGLDVTGVHNHFFFESPRSFTCTSMVMGKPADLARWRNTGGRPDWKGRAAASKLVDRRKL